MDEHAREVISQAEQIKELGRMHKNLSTFHRWQAKVCMEKYQSICKQLATIGIKLIINDADERTLHHGQQKDTNRF